MKFIAVAKKDMPKRTNHNLQARLIEFMNMGAPAVRIELAKSEYKNLTTAQSSFCTAIKRSGYPISCVTRNGNLYLIRLDM